MPRKDRRSSEEVLARNEHGQKQCKRCRDWFDESNFHAAPNTSDRLAIKCRPCTTWAAGPNRLEARNALLEMHGSVCWMYGGDNGGKTLHVDHDHSCCPSRNSCCSKCVRGLLCSKCNTGIGLLGDNLEGALRAVDYFLRKALC